MKEASINDSRRNWIGLAIDLFTKRKRILRILIYKFRSAELSRANIFLSGVKQFRRNEDALFALCHCVANFIVG